MAAAGVAHTVAPPTAKSAASSSAKAVEPKLLTGASTPNLIFDGASFESGNLKSAQLVSMQPVEYDLEIRPDTLNARHRIWFYFSVRGATRGQKVILNILGYSKNKSLFRDGMAPVVCSSGRPYWERMPPNSVYYVSC